MCGDIRQVFIDPETLTVTFPGDNQLIRHTRIGGSSGGGSPTGGMVPGGTGSFSGIGSGSVGGRIGWSMFGSGVSGGIGILIVVASFVLGLVRWTAGTAN